MARFARFATLAVLTASLIVAIPAAPAAVADGGGSVVAMAARPQGDGYWLAGADGSVTSRGQAGWFGSMAGRSLSAPIVGMAGTTDGGGYWLVGRDGGVFSFGDAAFYGSTGGLRLNRPVVAMAATPTGRGYWFVASDGGVFAYGDARFWGSTGSLRLNKPVVGMAATPSGDGYWLVASDGGVFAFGDATFWGSAGGRTLNQPIVAMAGTPSGRGYWFVASDGGVFSFGDARFAGSVAGSALPAPVSTMAANPLGGYWLGAGQGAVYSFGGAGSYPTGVSPSSSPCGLVPPQPPASSAYALETDSGNGRPLRWDPTQPIHYVVDPSAGPADALTLVADAVATVESATGLTFVDDGTYVSSGPAPSQPFQIRWASVSTTTEGGVTNYRWITTPDGNNQMVAATVTINSSAPLAPDFADGISEGVILLHELGHGVGLAHFADAGEVMDAVLSPTGPVAYGLGDLNGLWHVGAAAGCLG